MSLLAWAGQEGGLLNSFRRLVACWLWLAVLLASPMAGAKEITLSLKDADIKAVIGTVAEVTGRNFVVDPRVKGKVTIISSRPLDEDAIYEVFLSVLNVHGFAAVKAGNIIKIVPDANAKQIGLPIGGTLPKGDELVTRVIQLENVAAAQLVPILRPLVAQQGHLAAYPASNVLIVADRASNIRRLISIIERVDRPTDGKVDFIALEHASATEVVRILGSLGQAAAQGKPPVAGGGVQLVADERTNSVLVGGGKAFRLRMRVLIGHLDTPTNRSGNTQVVYLRFAQATDLLPVLTGVSDNTQQGGGSGGGKAVGAPKEPIVIQADETTNALVITAPPASMQTLIEVIRKLDIRRAQVLIEGVIAELSVDRQADLGVQWAVGKRDGPAAVLNFNNLLGIVGLVTDPQGYVTNPATPKDGLSVADLKVSTGGFQFAALLRALESDGDTNILSTPNLVTLDNEEAEMVVGRNVPFLTGSFTTDTSGANNPFQTIQREDVGLTLKVKPQISDGNAIKLEIDQEVSSIAPSLSVTAQDLVTNKRQVKTVVMVDDGEIVVLGGLIDDNVNQSEQKVPLLGDIPLLGALFRSRSNTVQKTSLMIFLHPTILRTAEDNTRVAGGKYNLLRAAQLNQVHNRGLVMSRIKTPVMPELGDYLREAPPFQELQGVDSGAVDLRRIKDARHLRPEDAGAN